MILERMVQKINPLKWGELEELDKQYNALEARFGFPPKRRYRVLFGNEDTSTLVIEREWESFAAMEAAHMQSMTDPEFERLNAAGADIVLSNNWEAYMVI